MLFITTANSLATIPDALRDRMEIIRLPGYLDHEKHAIARQFLIPKQLKAHGLEPANGTFAPDAVPAIMRQYTREAGVRELERRIARVRASSRARGGGGSARRRDGDADRRRVADLERLLGVPPFDEAEEHASRTSVGVATGLAYTSIGGDLLEIEVAVVRGRGRAAAHRHAGRRDEGVGERGAELRALARERARHRSGLPAHARRARAHPGGRDAQGWASAGIAIATAVVSALTGVPVRGDTAMTGEITLRGRVLPIGGLKEKLVAARRAADRARDHTRREQARARPSSPRTCKGGLIFHPVSNDG